MDTSADTYSAAATQLRTGLNSALTSADESATQNVQHLKLVQQARLTRLTRTAASLKAQASVKDDPNVTTAEAAVAAAKTTVGRLTMAHQQLGTPAPPVAAAGWAIHGRVFSADLSPAASRTVFLVNEQKAYEQEYGFSYTDKDGYFLLNYPASKGAATTLAAAQLFLEVANVAGKPVYLDGTPFTPTMGSATYRNILLPAGEQPLGDPPGAIRASALPAPARKTKSTGKP